VGTIVSVGTAVPPHSIHQQEVREFARHLFRDSFSDVDRLLGIFDRTAIQTRWFSRPREWFEQDHSFSDRNEAYIEAACRLGEAAVRRCLDRVGLEPYEVDVFLFVSTTGLATPSIDAHLINRLGMNPHVRRTPIWGLGCAGGAVGLSRAMETARAYPEARVLLLTVELCGLTFRREDRSKSNLVASSLFADGAAAVLLVGDRATVPRPTSGPRLLDAMSTTWRDSLEIMGWEVCDDGLQVVFSKDIPSIVRREVRPNVDRFLARRKLVCSDIHRWITHPGGLKVLQAYREAMDLPAEKLHHAQEVLRNYGNMSSATVLFVLEREMRESHEPGEYGLVTALGPGFSSELVLLQWEER
jgi:alkylresorcinol/alkylpyrone synthase